MPFLLMLYARSLAEVRLPGNRRPATKKDKQQKFSTVLVLVSIVMVSFLGATIPLSKWEQIISFKSCNPEESIAISTYPELCSNPVSSLLFDGWFSNYRHLDRIAELDNGRLLKFGGTPLSDIEAHKLKNDTNRNESKWRAQNRRFSFSNKNFRFADFSKLNLSLSEFDNSNLQGANFKEAVLNGAVFQNNTKLTGANFKEADMLAVNFENIKASKAVFENSHISRSVFKDSSFDYSDFRESRISDTYFKNIDFQNSMFEKVMVFTSSLVETDFGGATLDGSGIYATDITGNKSSFSASKMKNVHFFGVNLRGEVEFDASSEVNDSLFLFSEVSRRNIDKAKGWEDGVWLLDSGCRSKGCKNEGTKTYLNTQGNKSLSRVSKDICEQISEKLLQVDGTQDENIKKYGDLQLALWFFSNSNKNCLFNYSNRDDVWNKNRMNERAQLALKYKNFEPLIRTLNSLYSKGYSCDLGFCKKKPKENIKKSVENRIKSINSQFQNIGE